MKKVMLVDDEVFITEGIKNLIDWNSFGFEVVATAENGKDALEKLKEHDVDLIVTDINMPMVSGLELVKTVKASNNKVKFIILSGYDEFSYAKKAIEYGVESYILKPIDEDEMNETLKKIVQSIEEERKIESNILKKNNKLVSILNGILPLEQIFKVKDIKINLEGKAYTVSTILINNSEEETSNIDKLIDEKDGNNCETLYRSNGEIIIINSWNNDINEKEIFQYYEQLRKNISEDLNADVFIAIGNLVDNLLEIKESYKSSKNIKKYILTEGTNISLTEGDIKEINYKKMNFNKEIDQLNKILIEREKEKLKPYIEELFSNKELSPRNIYDLAIKIIILIDKTLDEFKVDKKYKKEGLADIIVALCNEATMENIKLFLVSELEYLITLMDDNNVVKYSPVVQQIVTIVNERYYEDLSLKVLAYQYNVNTSYLGQIFSKELGCSFSDYLNKTKNTKAKELILETNMRINDVAKAVGYSDSSYFYRKFKQFFGVSPSTLREIKNY